MKHCAHCKHREQAEWGDACFYRTEKDCYGFSDTKLCRELGDGGATYHCFEPHGDVEPWGALDWLLEAFDKLEHRVERIEEGLRMATKR